MLRVNSDGELPRESKKIRSAAKVAQKGRYTLGKKGSSLTSSKTQSGGRHGPAQTCSVLPKDLSVVGVLGPLGQTCSQLCCRLYWCLQHAFVISTQHTPWGISQPNTQPNSPSNILGKALTAFALSLTWTACHWVHQSDTHVLLHPWRVDSGLQSLSWRWISLWRHLLTTVGEQDDEVQGRYSWTPPCKPPWGTTA